MYPGGSGGYHETSDRNCSGGAAEVHDSPFILNRLMQTDVETTTTPPYFDPASPNNDFGAFGIWFYENGNDNEDDQANRAFDWFNEATNRNVADDPADPIRVTFASAQFGTGRVVAVGDSSPADDGTGEGGLHDGWDKASPLTPRSPQPRAPAPGRCDGRR